MRKSTLSSEQRSRFPDVLKTLLALNGFNREDLAKDLRVTEGYLSNICTCHSGLSSKRAREILATLVATPNDQKIIDDLLS